MSDATEVDIVKQARQRKAVAVLPLLLANKEFEVVLSQLVLRIVGHEEHDAEAWFDTLFEAEVKRDRAYAAAKEKFYDLLFHLSGGSMTHRAREQFEAHQHARRRRQGKQRRSEL